METKKRIITVITAFVVVAAMLVASFPQEPQIVTASPDTHTYNFVGITAPSTTHIAYEIAGSGTNPTSYTPASYIASATEASDQDYTDISLGGGDNNRWDTGTDQTDLYDSQLYTFDINPTQAANAIQIDVEWQGYGTARGTQTLYVNIWDYNSSAWVSVGSASAKGTLDAKTDNTITNTFAPGNYISGNKICVLAHLQYLASCPFGYVWNGEKIEFVNDLGAAGILGVQLGPGDAEIWELAPGGVAPPNPRNLNKLPLEPKDGYYDLRATQEFNEISYLDELKLLVVDHSPDADVYTGGTYFAAPTNENLYTVSKNPLKPISCVDEAGRDCWSAISSRDGIFRSGETMHWDRLELDLGNLSDAETIKLVMTAYSQWPSNASLRDYLFPMPYLEVKDENGNWVESGIDIIGLPFAFPMTYVVDLSDVFLADDYRIRLNLYNDVNIDQIAVDTTPQQDITIHTLSPISADLHYRGFSEWETVDGTEPPLGLPNYEEVQEEPIGVLATSVTPEGKLTKYGDVLPLLEEVDDKFVIMAQGDEVSVKFEEILTSEDMERSYFSSDWIYYKQPDDMPYPFAVEPLPFSGMSNFPYPPWEHYPDDAEHLSYLEEWNTREYEELELPPAHNSAYTDYVEVVVTYTEVPVAGITVDPTSGLVTTETGVTDSFTVVLDTLPTADVTVGISSDDPSEGTASPASLTFGTGNWSAPQTVTVTGVNDDVEDGDIPYSIATAVAVSGDSDYNGIKPDDVSVTNQDDDTAGVTIVETTGSTDVDEEGPTNDTYSVELDSEPTADVDISITPDAQVTVDPSALTFGSGNWSTPQDVTVTAVDDADIECPHTGTITHSASSTDAKYNGISIDDVIANIADNDGADLAVQMAMILDGSGSISSGEWDIMLDGLAAAVQNVTCVPQDCSVELTVIQFSDNAHLEVGPVVISESNVADVAADILDLKDEQMEGSTCIACGICLAANVLHDHPDSHFSADIKQALNLVTDGEPNRCCNCTTDCSEWECLKNSCSGTAKASAEAARTYALNLLAMTDDQDEFDAEAVGDDPDVGWLRDYIVWPQPGYDTWPPAGPGWVRHVESYNEVAETICEKFQLMVPEECTLTVTSDGCCPIAVEWDASSENVSAYGSGNFTVPCCNNVTLTADEDACCAFVNWTGDVTGGTNTTNPITFHMDSDKAVTATCANISYNLTVTSDGCCPVTVEWDASSENVSAYGSGNFTVPCCNNVTLTADESDVCCDFVRWTGDVPGAPNTTNPITFHMDSSKNVTAHCTKLEPVMTIDMDVDPHDVVPGGQVKYTIDVINHGSTNATNVSIRATLPTYFTYASTDNISDAGTTRSSTDPTPGDTVPLWDSWSIPSGLSVTIDFIVDVDPAASSGTYDSTAYADGDNFEQIDDEGEMGQDPNTPPGEDPEDDEDVTIRGGPPPVGGEVYPVNKIAILAPWITLIAAIVVGAAILTRRRKQGIWIGLKRLPRHQGASQ